MASARSQLLHIINAVAGSFATLLSFLMFGSARVYKARQGPWSFVPRKQWREIVDFLDPEHTEVLDGFLEPRDFAWEPSCGHYTIYNTIIRHR
jgi:hypothetical protein